MSISQNRSDSLQFCRCPAATSTNARIVRERFGDNAHLELPIPKFIDDYNHFMGGVDIADQLCCYYSTQLVLLQNWYPLFFWILDLALTNSYLLSKWSGAKWSHKDFRMSLVRQLLKGTGSSSIYYTQKIQPSVRVNLGSFQSDPIAENHHLVKASKQGYCLMCRWNGTSSNSQKFGTEITNSQRKQPPQSSWICKACKVHLCDIDCNDKFHSMGLNR